MLIIQYRKRLLVQPSLDGGNFLKIYAGVIMDSFDIARWTDAHSERKDANKLFPDGQLEAISRCDGPYKSPPGSLPACELNRAA